MLCLSYIRIEWVNFSFIFGIGFGFLIVIWFFCNFGVGGCFDGVNRGGGGSMVFDDGGDIFFEGGGWMVFGGGGGIMDCCEGSDFILFVVGLCIFFGVILFVIVDSDFCNK